MKSQAATVDEYLAELTDAERAALAGLRELVRRTVPEARESMKYGLPHYDLHGPLFALAAQKHYMALYVAETGVVANFRPRLSRLDVGTSCIRFRRPQDLPESVTTELLLAAADRRRQRFRLQEIS